EEDQEESVFIPPRAALPVGVTNYVTPFGLQQLLEERKLLETERAQLDVVEENERRRALAVIDGKMNLLNERINSARVIEPQEQVKEEIRFGAKVKLEEIKSKKILEFQIVGVDEANVKQQKIAFIAPIARAVTGKMEGETAELNLGGETRIFRIQKVTYQ
ncbi:MAG TPA: GreA/GreB family elongation factor, partial [Salinimicrobium sp.]|nr:GreA/GreB family elongation factor [Salinimicrobium sp.]